MSTEHADTAPAQDVRTGSPPGALRTYWRLLGYTLRYKRRMFAILIFSLVVGASLGSMILSVGTVIDVLYLEDAELADRLDATTADIRSFTEMIENRIGWAPQGIDERVEGVIWAMHSDRAHALRVLAGVIVVLTLIGAGARFLQEYYGGAIGVSVSTKLNEEMFDNVVNLSHAFFDRRSAGEIVARFTNDSFMVNHGVTEVFTRMFREPIKIAFCLGLAMSVNVFLTLVVLFVVSPVLFIVLGISKSLKTTVHRSLNRIADMASIITETVRGMSIVKGFQMEVYKRRRMREELGRLRRHMKNIAKAHAAVGPITETMMILGIGAFLILSEREVSTGTLTGGDLVRLFLAIAATLDPLRRLSRMPNLIQLSAASATRVFEFIDYEPDVAERPGAIELPPIRDRLRFEQVRFSYDGDTEVLRGVDFEVKRGEMVALVGFSGEGKSTVAKLIPRFYDPVEGRITLDGVDIRDATLASLRGQIGIVTQETILFREAVETNIAFGQSDYSGARVEAAARAANADRFIEALPGGYGTELSESGGNLSGGQRQRLAIARAIIKDPAILILDEATSSLDSESEKAILQAIDEFVVGRTTIVIAHRLSTVQKADRIVVLDQGQVVEQGTHEELLAKDGIYHRLYRLQFADHKQAGAS